MPTKIEHITQAEHNRDFWSSYNLSSTPFLDWVVIGIFYEGVHWVEAYLDTKREHSGDHSQRLSNIRRYSAAVARDIEILKHESVNARYRCHHYIPTDISNDLMPIVDNIKTHIQSLF